MTAMEKVEPLSIKVEPEQAAQFALALELAKAFASPIRLALVGILAARLQETLTVEQLAGLSNQPTAKIERDLRQLIEAGLVKVVEWAESKPGREPQPALVGFNLTYLQQLPQVISTLHRVNSQLNPAEATAELDERAQVLARFMKNGRVISWPTQYKKQLYIIEEVVKRFDTDRDYTEREVDAVLKEVYEYDHVTLRRYLIDLRFMQREKGIYRRI